MDHMDPQPDVLGATSNPCAPCEVLQSRADANLCGVGGGVRCESIDSEN